LLTSLSPQGGLLPREAAEGIRPLGEGPPRTEGASATESLELRVRGGHAKDVRSSDTWCVQSAFIFFLFLSALIGNSATITESFSTDPLQRGWRTHGDAS